MRPPRAAGRIERGSAFSASMYRDLDAGFHTEGDQVVDDMLRRARAHRIATPLLPAAAYHLQIHERRLAAQFHSQFPALNS
ncbi:MAG: ketopantoate reductase C-terminal domain-containing protein [Stellaceae bacterium]